jgi:SAM-dependent methyltransferase
MSLERLLEHRRLWGAKPVLARVYEPWFSALLDAAPRGARVLEVGAGPGFLREAARDRRPDLRWIASDLHAAPWNTLAADAGRLPFAAASLDTVVGLDVLHHLAAPADFFREAARALRAGGRIALVEPWITAFSWPIYRFIHQEDCRLSVDPWQPFPAGGKDSFEGDAAVPWRMARDTPAGRWSELGLRPPRVVRLNAFAYLLSLGFRPAALLPAGAAPALIAADRAMLPLAPLTALRAILTWHTTQSAGGGEKSPFRA